MPVALVSETISFYRRGTHSRSAEETAMLSWVLIFSGLALIAAILGFGGLAAGITNVAQILFVIFFALFAVSLIGKIFSVKPVV